MKRVQHGESSSTSRCPGLQWIGKILSAVDAAVRAAPEAGGSAAFNKMWDIDDIEITTAENGERMICKRAYV